MPEPRDPLLLPFRKGNCTDQKPQSFNIRAHDQLNNQQSANRQLISPNALVRFMRCTNAVVEAFSDFCLIGCVDVLEGSRKIFENVGENARFCIFIRFFVENILRGAKMKLDHSRENSAHSAFCLFSSFVENPVECPIQT